MPLTTSRSYYSNEEGSKICLEFGRCYSIEHTWCIIMEVIFLGHLPAKLSFTSMNSGPGIKNDWIYSCCCSGRCWDDWIYHVRLSACLISSVHHWNSLVELLQNISDYVRASLMSAVSLAQSYQTLSSVKTRTYVNWNGTSMTTTTPLHWHVQVSTARCHVAATQFLCRLVQLYFESLPAK